MILANRITLQFIHCRACSHPYEARFQAKEPFGSPCPTCGTLPEANP